MTDKQPNPKPKRPFWQILAIYGMSIAMLAVGFSYFFGSGDASTDAETLSYSEFVAAVQNGEVVSGTMFATQDRFEGEFAEDDPRAIPNAPDISISYPGESEDELEQTLITNGVDLTIENPLPSGLGDMLFTIIMFGGLIFVLWFLILRPQMGGGKGGGVFGFGKAKTKTVAPEAPKVTFADVAGIDEAKEEVEEIKDFLANPEKYAATGARIPKGVLLVGPPGCGKTLLARATAGEANAKFLSISGSDFVEMFVGVGAARVRDLFEQARKEEPCIIFIDEIDAVGRQRGAGLGGGHDEREQTLNQLLVEMDGFDGRTAVIVMAATNRPDILDPALLRPGRFGDRQIVVDRPDLEGREQILKVHMRGKPIDFGTDKDRMVHDLARQTPGFTGADLENLVNEAALLAARNGKAKVDQELLEAAIDRVMTGPERKGRAKRMDKEDKRAVARHEAGHTLVGYVMPKLPPMHKVTIMPRTKSLGHAQALPEKDQFLHWRSELLDRMAFALGGRAAEEYFYDGDMSTGAENDLDHATDIAKAMVMDYGMSIGLGARKYRKAGGGANPFLGKDYGSHQDFSDEVAKQIDTEIRVLVDEAHREAALIIETYGGKGGPMEKLIEELIEHETLNREQIADALEGVEKWSRDGDGNLIPPQTS